MKNTLILADSKTQERSVFFVEDITRLSFSDKPAKDGFKISVHRRFGGPLTLLYSTQQEQQMAIGQLNFFMQTQNDKNLAPQPVAAPAPAENNATAEPQENASVSESSAPESEQPASNDVELTETQQDTPAA